MQGSGARRSRGRGGGGEAKKGRGGGRTLDADGGLGGDGGVGDELNVEVGACKGRDRDVCHARAAREGLSGGLRMRRRCRLRNRSCCRCTHHHRVRGRQAVLGRHDGFVGVVTTKGN